MTDAEREARLERIRVRWSQAGLVSFSQDHADVAWLLSLVCPPPRAVVGGEAIVGEPSDTVDKATAWDMRQKARAAGFAEGVEACWKHLSDGGFVVALVRAEKEIRALAAAKGEVA